ncbi:MAG: hypothetical protein HY089_04345, partial [Ignavibacteriales bacterium]|nr:hypothetical protein [Ignavibacteriales bacterium]
VIFGPVGTDTSTSYSVRATFFGADPPLPKKPVNFKVINISENKQTRFAFWEFDNDGGSGVFSANVDEQDIIILLEKDSRDSLVMTWGFSVRFDTTGGKTRPQPGDTATIVLSKIFRSSDVFEFTTQAQKIDPERAKTDLDKIKVVPNPYVATATWEERNTFNTGRGPRSIHFTHLPQVCTIRIYSVSGELVSTIDHNSALLDGSAEWNLLTRDALPASYGVYIYHIDAPGIGEKVGKFAVIK